MGKVPVRSVLMASAAMWAASLALVPGARGQVAWDSPLFLAPATPPGWGVYLVDPSPGKGIGVLGTWRGGEGPGGVGFRLGLGEDRADDLSVFGGVDFSGILLRASDEIPVHLVWVLGAGVGAGGDVLLSFPLGVTVGRDLEADGVWFNPYITPRVVLDAWLGERRGGDSLELGFAVDLGVDLSLDPGWAIRFGGTLGERSAVGIGMSFRVF